MRNNKLRQQVRDYIKSTVEGYLNGCYDGGYEPMTKEEWLEYVWKSLIMDRDAIVNGEEFEHLFFFGKENFLKEVERYLETYDDVKEWIKK